MRTLVKFFVLCSGLFAFLLVASMAASAQVTPAEQPTAAGPVQPNAPTADPEFILDAGVSQFATGAGFLYWSYFNSNPNLIAPRGGDGAPTIAPAAINYLQRWPLNGGRVITLANGDVDTLFLHANELGLYYYSLARGAIILRPLSDPTTDVLLAYTTRPDSLVSDAGTRMMYWLSNGKLYFSYRDHFTSLGAKNEMTNSGANPHDVVLGGDTLYWLGDGVIYSTFKGCLFGFSGCTRDIVVAENGRGLLYYRTPGVILGSFKTLHWISGTTIRSYGCIQGNLGYICGPDTTYNNAPYGPPAGHRLVGAGPSIFWVETGGGDPAELKRFEFGAFGSGAATIAGGQGKNYRIHSALAPANGWIYLNADFNSGPDRIGRIRIDAPPILPDLEVTGLEVTQGIQSPAQDVALVAAKPTYVRVYARKLVGPRAGNVSAKIDVWRGAAYLGALRPLQGNLPFPLPGDANASDRRRSDQSWVFQLPDEWTSPGGLRLRAVVNPDRLSGETNTANNATERTVSFLDKAPVCTVFIRVRTANTAALFTPNHWFAISMAERLLPTPQLWTYQQSDDIAELEARFGIPPWKYGPYEIEEDSGKMLTSLWWRDQLSDDPDECDDANARTHYIGIVDPNESGNNGSGRLGGDQLWIRLPPPDFSSDWQTDRAPTLAHELGHNYDRRHIDCPPGDPDDVGGYDYPVCQIDHDDTLGRHYGFTFNNTTGKFEVILPTTVGDLMSYAHRLDPPKARWTSDFSWRALLNEVPNREYGAQAQAAAPALAAADEVVLVAGSIDPAQPDQSSLGYTWVYPTSAVSQAMVRKWQRAAAPAVSEVRAAGAAASYHLRLLDADGNVLDDRAVTPFEDRDSAGSSQVFGLSFPAPAGQVARIELLDGEALLASLQAGANPPALQILQPAGGETIDQAMTLSWTASDPDPGDRLLFTVQYSPDSGATWRTVLSDYPNLGATDTVTVNLRDLSGIPASTTGGLLRVAASDGLHTTLATSEPFTVLDRGPQAFILAPAADRPIASPAATIVLQGAATDAEAGGPTGPSLSWQVSGPMNASISGSGRQFGLAGLGPGVYDVALTATDSAANAQTANSHFTVAPLSIPAGASPVQDGLCDDDAYANAIRIPLRPYTDGSQAAVLVTRTSSHLWACFTDLKRAGGTSPGSFVTVRVDANNSRETTPQVGDFEHQIYEDGMPFTKQGNGATFVPVQAGGVVGQVSADATHWNAEMTIPAAALGNWSAAVGLDFDHNWVNAGGDDYRWPHRSDWWNPSTWATTVFGAAPQLSAIEPAAAIAGDTDITLTVTGAGFADGASALWNGVAQATTFISATSLQATIGAADLAAAGAFKVTVQNPDLGGPVSNPAAFLVKNPAPAITQASLAGTQLTVMGTGFVDGARVWWDGLPQPTTFVDSTQLQAEIGAWLIPANGLVEVRVANPDPSAGPSNVWQLAIGEAESGSRLFLPWLANANAAPAPDLVIYDDALAASWQNWSWSSTVDFDNASPRRTGLASVSIQFDAAWAGFSVRAADAIDAAGYQSISFWVYGSGSGNPLSLYTQASDNGGESSMYDFTAPSGVWTQIVAPLSALGNPAAIKRINLQDASGAAQPVFYLDALRLLP